TPLIETFKKADEVLLQAVKGISDLINIRGLINLDFADIKTVMAAQGMAIMGAGIASGENRAVEAATEAISSPLLENIAIDGATGIIINVTGGPALTLWEVNEASTLVTDAAHEDAEIIFGAVIDETMGDNIQVTVIATGFGAENKSTVDAQINKLQEMARAQLAMQANHHSPASHEGQRQLQQEFYGQSVEASSNHSSNNYVDSRVNHGFDPRMSQNFEPRTMSTQESSLYEQPQTTQRTYVPHSELEAMNEMRHEAIKPVTSPAAEKPVLPRDTLLAKVKAYREAQEAKERSHMTQEQLSMNIDEQNSLSAAKKMAEDVVKSSFRANDLDVPSYLRRGNNGGENE
ncbi:MAG: cell division protein FtsZ, partial [Bdellovibrionales bacterium]|nr:cell division protein FtsZ [Bdellovibrionales bacterium]